MMILIAMKQYLAFCLLVVAVLIIEVDAFTADLIRCGRRTIATAAAAAAATKTDSQMENNIHPSSSFPSSSSSSAAEKKYSLKRIVFIRHGQTYMNELIGGGGISFGSPNFTDIFVGKNITKYEDSPLSETGIQQAISLNHKLRNLKNNKSGAIEALGLLTSNTTTNTNTNTSTSISFLDDLDLVVVSPLTRALQTMEQALYEHIINKDDDNNDNDDVHSDVPIIAMPKAAERLYLVSDIGKSRSELRIKYPWVDFDTGFAYDSSQSNNCSSSSEKDNNHDDYWHFSPSKEIADNYIEWRPHGQGQAYACLGEPQEYFDHRMTELYLWLESRKEQCIAIICHAGVIDWMTSGDVYSNCELRVQTFNSLRPRNLSNRKQI
ncbi:MAG: broad specificity phosphatase PhoE [Bacillariaceae sp.]|jgi:broad specificity phosphatase PhoE